MNDLSDDAISLRVLVVDDNRDSAQMLGWGIEAANHEVRLAFNGADALDIAKDFVPQIVLLDIGLPNMNGYEICQTMRQLPELSDTIFIAQTGMARNDALAKDAFDNYLIKPIDLEALLGLIGNVTARKIAN